MLATVPLALAGSAAPTLWLLLERAASLLSVAMGYRLGARWGGKWAGALAALGLLLSGGWTLAVAQGYTEAFTAGLLFLAIDREIDGHSTQALALGTLVALSRPEALLFLCLFAVFAWRRKQVRPLAALSLVAAVPLLWIVPDWIGSGQLFHASAVSREVVPTGAAAAGNALREAVLNPPIPLSVCGLAFIALDRRGRSGIYGRIALLVLAWFVLLTVLMFGFGYPASGRFFDPATALACVLGGVGAVRLADKLGPRRQRLVAGLLVAVAGLTIGLRVDPTIEQARATVVRGRLVDQLHGVIDRAGRGELRGCQRVLVPGNMGWLRGAVAWDLHMHIRRVLGVWTSAPDYIEQLGAHELDATPPLPAGPVRIGRLKPRAALLLPFNGTRVVGTRGVTPRLSAVAVDGRWTAYAVGRSSCLTAAA